eukprot:scaffold21422_cov103-Skeletonema_dohrnii-CCMP3373.AAC.6
MQRTEQSRRHVMLQISLLTPNQRVALEEARHRQLQAIQTEALISVQTLTSTRELRPTRSIAGSRGTLTNGLEEQSRRQERNYMGQIHITRKRRLYSSLRFNSCISCFCFDGTVKDDDEETKINSHSSEDIMINDNNYHSHSMCTSIELIILHSMKQA